MKLCDSSARQYILTAALSVTKVFSAEWHFRKKVNFRRYGVLTE